ncbi:MAG TPA: hypothetical protein VME41_14690 [Stellaceae bacterium]|nr:hypothetical protein [Stellaceae bacterium]
MDGENERQRAADGLRRIDDLVAALDDVRDAAARAAARDLAEAILDVHGLALARVMAIVAASDGGRDLVARLAEDEQVKAILLLYGLHPEEPRLRLQRALDSLRPRLAAHGIGLDLVHVSSRSAAIRVSGGAATDALREEIEQTILDAAPELDEIIVEWPDADVAEAAALAR